MNSAPPASTARKRSLIVIGGGMSAIKLLDELSRYEADYKITVFCDERHFGYNRIQLSPVLAGEKSIADLALKSAEWYVSQGVKVRSGAQNRIVAIDRKRRTVESADGGLHRYDRLVIAIGSRPLLPDWFGAVSSDPACMAFRSLEDVERMQALCTDLTVLNSSAQAVVIGAGLLGLEAAYGLARMGMRVTVVHRASHLLNRQLDETAADLLQSTLEAKGIEFILGADVAEARLSEADEWGRTLKQLHLKDGSRLAADLLVAAIGIQPNVDLGRASGLQMDAGIAVSDCMQTSDPAIYAIGECISHRRSSFGMVAPLYEQARVCANHLAEHGIDFFSQKPLAASLKISGVQLFSMGDTAGSGHAEGREEMTLLLREQGIYKRLVISGERLLGVVLYGDIRDAAWYQSLIESGRSIRAYRDALLHGQRFLAAN